MFHLQNTPGRTCRVDGKEFLFFSGYSYLGMNHVKKFKDFVKEGIDKYGILFPSSRISNTRLKLYAKFENRLSQLTGMEKTVSFSSGFLAGKTISDILLSYKNIFVAPGTHPAINIKNNTASSLNFEEWQNKVVHSIKQSNEKEFLIAADSVNILNASINNFLFLQNIDSSKKIIVLIDDSHGIGILGGKGEGIISQLPKKDNIEYVLSYSLSKAFGIEGGAVSCSKKWADKLRQHCNYTGSTAISPSLVYTFMRSKGIYNSQRKKLRKNIARFKKNISAVKYKHDFDLPIFIYEKGNLPAAHADAESHFYKNKIIISSFSYPNPSSNKINRIIINALHTEKDIQKLCNSL